MTYFRESYDVNHFKSQKAVIFLTQLFFFAILDVTDNGNDDGNDDGKDSEWKAIFIGKKG